MKKLILIFILSLLPSLALAQTSRNPCFINATGGCTPVSTTNPLPVDATVNASVTGFEPAATGTPITVTTLGVTGTLPAGDVVAVFNVGTTNTAYCKLGASSTTSDIAIPPASWFAFTVGAATQLTCITSTSTTTVNMVGGTGLPTGAGGGGGGSGGGAVTIANGADASEGATTDAACAGDNTSGCTVQQRLQRIAQNITTLNTTAGTGTGNTGSGVPAAAIYSGLNVAGNLRGATGSNPSGSIYAQQMDVVAVNGTSTNSKGVPTYNGANTYNTVAASQTAQALTGGGGGATGDYLSHCVLQPTTTGAGTMTILDNATTVFTFTTGTLSNLSPIPIPIGAVSVSGAWKVTTGANETVTCFGKFT